MSSRRQAAVLKRTTYALLYTVGRFLYMDLTKLNRTQAIPILAFSFTNLREPMRRARPEVETYKKFRLLIEKVTELSLEASRLRHKRT